MMEDVQFHSKGKFLLLGEYFVLSGCKALAVPLKPGQTSRFSKSNNPGLQFQSYYIDEKWFDVLITNLDELFGSKMIENTEVEFLRKLCLLSEAQDTDFKNKVRGLSVKNVLEFSPAWGMGSSSSLLVNWASYFNLDPFELNQKLFGGSSYDIAAASADSAGFFWKDKSYNWLAVELSEFLLQNLFFVYSGKKQRSAQEVKKFNAGDSEITEKCNRVNSLVDSFAQTDSFEEAGEIVQSFNGLLEPHIERKSADDFYSDFKGVIKWMGAWEGDFMLLMSPGGLDYIQHYCQKNNLGPLYSANQLLYLKS